MQNTGFMYTTEILNGLRTLNWLEKERRYLTAGSAAARLVEKHQADTRAKLPLTVLALHDRFTTRGKPSVVELSGSSCTGCHLKLPSGLLGELRTPERFVICPNCNTFVWSGEHVSPEVLASSKKPSKKKAFA